MKKTIRIRYLLLEGRRQWKFIVIIGILLAIAVTALSYSKTQKAAAGMMYASECSFKINFVDETLKLEQGTEDTDYKTTLVATDMGEMLNRIIKSDYLIEKVKQELNDPEKYTTEYIRNCIYSQQYSEGRLVEIYVLADSQDLSDRICNCLEKNLESYFSELGFSARVIDSTYSFGPAVISQTQIYQSTEKTTVLSAASAPAFGAVRAAKIMIVGFVFGAIIAYLLVCLLYILKDSAIYDGELEDAGIRVAGTISSGAEREVTLRRAVTSALLDKEPIEKLVVVGLGSAAPSEVETVMDASGSKVKTIITAKGDISKQPEELLEIQNADAAAIFVKSDTVKLGDISKLIKDIEDAGCRFAGVMFEN